MVLHFYAFCPFRFNGVICDSFRTFVVGKNICSRLWIPEIFEDLPESSAVLSCEETGDVFSFTYG